MKNASITRIEVADRFGEILYDSTAKPWRWRRESDTLPAESQWPDAVTPLPRARRCEIPQPFSAFAAEPAESRAIGALVSGLAIALAAGAAIAAIALMVAA